jgi:hypothetical protein
LGAVVAQPFGVVDPLLSLLPGNSVEQAEAPSTRGKADAATTESD